MATEAILSGHVSSWRSTVLPTRPPKFVRVFFDGGVRENMASYGYVLYAVFEDNHEGDVGWIKIADYGELLVDITMPSS